MEHDWKRIGSGTGETLWRCALCEEHSAMWSPPSAGCRGAPLTPPACPSCARLSRERDEANDRAHDQMDAAGFLRSRGYRRCDIPACNCGSWHEIKEEHRCAKSGAALLSAQSARALLLKARRWIVAGHTFHDIAAAKGCDVCMVVAEIDAHLAEHGKENA